MYSKTELKFMYKNLSHDFAETGKLLPELKTILNLLSREHDETKTSTLDMVVPMQAFVTFMNAIPQGQARANKFLKANCPAKPFCIRASQTSLREHVLSVKGKKFEAQECAFCTAKEALGKPDGELLDYNDLCTFFTYFRFCKDCMKNGLIETDEEIPDDESVVPSEPPSEAPSASSTPRKTSSLKAITNMVISVGRMSKNRKKEDQTEQDQAKQDQAEQEQAKQDQAEQEQAKQEQAKQEQAKQDQAEQEQAKQDQKAEEKDQTAAVEEVEAKPEQITMEIQEATKI